VKNIAVFASGTGTNAEKIVQYFKRHQDIARVALIVSNKADALVLDMAEREGVDRYVLKRKAFYQTKDLLNVLHKYQIDLIVLAGFLWLVPPYLVAAFQGKMINIHPALLPKFGGKGMYGMNVHKAVKENGEKESGITIHYVNEAYDEGHIIFQAKCAIAPEDQPKDIARKVQQLEHLHFAPEIAKLLQQD
jgi:phosphoribosylglycinamide formyltransferase-1